MLLISLLSMFLAAAQPEVPAEPADTPAIDCSAHKFETVVQTTVDGEPKASKVKLCGEPGQTDAQWLATLEDAIRKVKADERMAPAVKDQITFALRAELARLTPAEAPAPEPVAPAPVVAVVPPPPAPKPVIAKPSGPVKLSLRCRTPGDMVGMRDCDELQSDTSIAVKADEALAGGATLRFIRDGQQRGEVALGALRRGQTVNIRLPGELCARILRTDFTIEVVRRGGAAEQTLGPFLVRC